MKRLSSIEEIMFSDLIQKCLDAEFDDTYPENGSFITQKRRGKDYWYYQGFKTATDTKPGKQYIKYVGAKGNPNIDERVERFDRVKVGYRERRSIATKLRQSGLPTPSRLEGDILKSLSKAGIFRLRGVLVGSVAFQAYSGLLGVKLPNMSMRTDDVDIAQDFGISQQIDDRIDDIEESLKSVDPTFSPILRPGERKLAASFRNNFGFKVDIVTPNRGSDDNQGSLSKLPSLGENVGAYALRFLDFLIREPVVSLILHDSAVAVTVPAPERFAIHKMLVSTNREGVLDSKASKDLRQASDLIHAFAMTRRLHDVGLAWIEACDRGKSWKRRLSTAILALDENTVDQISQGILMAAELDNVPAEKYLLGIKDKLKQENEVKALDSEADNPQQTKANF